MLLLYTGGRLKGQWGWGWGCDRIIPSHTNNDVVIKKTCTNIYIATTIHEMIIISIVVLRIHYDKIEDGDEKKVTITTY